MQTSPTAEALSRAAIAFKDAVDAFMDALARCVRKVIRFFRKLAKQLDPKWQRRHRRATPWKAALWARDWIVEHYKDEQEDVCVRWDG